MRNIYITGVLVALMVPLVAFQNCGNLQSAAFQVDDSTFESLSTSDRAVDLETILTGLIEQERRERMQADAALEGRINALEELVTQNRLDLEEQIGVLTQNQALLQAEVDGMRVEFDQRLSTLMVHVNDLAQQLNISMVELQEYVDCKIDHLAADVEAQMDGLITYLTGAIQANENADRERHEALLLQISMVKEDVVEIKISHEELLAYINQTFVTQAEFNQLKESYDDLKAIAASLDMKIDQTREELEAQLGEELALITVKISEIHGKIHDLQLADIDFSAQLDQVITDYRTELAALGESLKQAIFETEDRVLYLVAQGDQATRNDLLDEIRVQAATQTLYIRTSLASFADKIRQLESQIAANDNSDEVAALEANLNDAKQEISQLIAIEQKQREELQNQVDQLAEEIGQVKKDIEMVHLVSLENRRMINNLTVAFDEHKTAVAQKFGVLEVDLNQKIEALKFNFESQMGDLMTTVASLAEGLGQSFQDQLTQQAQEIALLKNKIANHQTTLVNLAQDQRDDRAKIIQLEARLAQLTTPYGQSLTLVVSNYLRVQEIFMTILAPDDSNLQPWDQDFTQFTATCNGDANLSFPNAMGMESFQFLNLEFLRMLLAGVRSGSDSDQIFHNFGEAFQGTGFHRAIVTTMSNQAYGAAVGDCLDKIQHWSRRILFEEASFNSMRLKLANSSDLAAAIEELYRSLAILKADSDQIYEIILNFTDGMFNETHITDVMMAQFSINFINFAMNHMTVSNLINHIHNTTVIQREIGGEEKFEARFRELMSKLDGFAVRTDQRITALENQVGTLTAQMEQVLKRLSCTTAPGCLPPVFVGPAPIPVEPPPIPPPSCSEPRVAFVQHFFTSPFASAAIRHWGPWEKHLNNEEAKVITSPTRLCEATAQTALEDLKDLNINSKRGCWVNFRKVPAAEWGNAIDTFGLRVHGQMSKVRIQCEGAFDQTFDLQKPNDRVVTYGDNKKGIFDIQLPNALTGENFQEIVKKENRYQDCTVTPICTNPGAPYEYQFKVWSPLVLDFKTQGAPDLTSTFGGVRFDLDADGQLDQTAWVTGLHSALLVLDRNKDGQINDGSELFGQSFYPNQDKNGFQVLASFDSHKDGWIDANDSVFPDLRLWFDKNSDGVSQKEELIQLGDRGVKRISLSYRKNSPADSFAVIDSEIKYSSVFVGPKACGEKGCQIHDIYFGKVKARQKIVAE